VPAAHDLAITVLSLIHSRFVLGIWIANARRRCIAKLQGFSADALLLGHSVRELDGSGNLPH